MTYPDQSMSVQAAPDEVALAASATLRRLALDEDLKARVSADPALSAVLARIAQRYVSGLTVNAALARVRALNGDGHTATVDFMGESARDAATVHAATDEFRQLISRVAEQSTSNSVSLDLSHIGGVLDRELGLGNARLLAQEATRAGIDLVLSMEGHDRIQQILDDHAVLCEDFGNVGITVQTRLHRTATDLPLLLQRPGRIRLVKGSYATPDGLATQRTDPATLTAYDHYAATLLRSGHPCSIATHDWDRLAHAEAVIDTEHLRDHPYRFEFLTGLGPQQMATMQRHGHPTQEYVLYGTEWWLYVCNRLAEDPTRIWQAVTDADRT